MTFRYGRSPGTCGAAIWARVRFRTGWSGATACGGRGDERDCRATPPATAARQQAGTAPAKGSLCSAMAAAEREVVRTGGNAVEVRPYDSTTFRLLGLY